MDSTTFAVVIASLCALSPSDGLKCHEGFNMTFNGIPLYYWTQRDCAENSKCIGQEIAVDTALTGSVLRTAMRYGSCMSNAYAEYLDCDNLFGKDSTFDPALLLDMLPGIATAVNNSVQELSQNIPASFMQLLSNGGGIAEFIDGAYTFYGNLGFNMAKAEPLKAPIVDLLTAIFQNPGPAGSSAVSQALEKLLNAFAQLDTDNAEFETALRSLLNTLGVNNTMIDSDIFATTFVKKGPGLLRSIFPSNWQPQLWYDVAFKLIGDVNIKDWTKTTEDMVATIKSSYDIPADIAEYVNPILDAMPDLARGALNDGAYVGNWSLELLKKFSEEDAATKEFSTALINFVEQMTGGMPLQYEFKTTIQWVPGLFYKLIPEDKAVIAQVYTKMAVGFKSVTQDQLFSSPGVATKLSMMIENMVTRFGGPGIFNQSEPQGQLNKAFVLKFSKMFYDLLNVTMDYTPYVDTFATVIDDGFATFPTINVGDMMSKLITGMGGEVPKELVPLLKTIQDVVTAGMDPSFNHTKLLEAFYGITKAYKTEFPTSPFPKLVERYIKLMTALLLANPNDPNYAMITAQYNLEFQYWNIDLHFAIIKAYNYSSDELYQMLVKAWPAYDVYIRMMQAMDPEDVKGLLKKILHYFSTPPPFTTQGFVDATKPTFQNMTKSIIDLMGEIRETFSPNSCRFRSCDGDLCNNQALISSAQEYTKAAPTISTTTMSTTSAGFKISHNILHVAILWMAAKAFL